MAATMTLGRRRKQRHNGTASSRRVDARSGDRDDEEQLMSITSSACFGQEASLSSALPQPPAKVLTSSARTYSPTAAAPAALNTSRQPLSLQCLKYDSGFGSIFSSSVSSSFNSGSGASGPFAPLGPLPPPPPYRRVSLPAARPLRIHRSYSDSKHRSCRRLDYLHCISPWCSWSAATSRSPSPSMTTVSCPEYGDLQDKLQRLESDRESLSLQVSVLAEQVGAQTDKIRDLESMLEDKKVKLDSTEEMLHEELVTRTSLETNKLDLMGEISNLKLKMAALERDKYEREQQLKLAQSQIAELQSRRSLRCAGDHEEARFPAVVPDAYDRASEVNTLRAAVQRLLTNNAEKENEIETLRRYIDGESTSNYQYRAAAIECQMGPMPRTLPAACSDYGFGQAGCDVSPRYRKLLMTENQLNCGAQDVPPDEYGRSSSANFIVNPCADYGADYHRMYGHPMAAHHLNQYPLSVATSGGYYPSSPMSARMRASPAHVPSALVGSGSAGRLYSSGASRQLAAELDQLALQYRSPPLSAVGYGYSHQTGSLPRQIVHGSSKRYQNGDQGHMSGEDDESPFDAHSDDPSIASGSHASETFKRNRKYSSLRNFVSKIKRSTSEEGLLGGGLQKGTKPRAALLGMDQPGHLPLLNLSMDRKTFSRPALSVFCKWNSDQLSEWFCELGLSCYVTECQQNLKSGRHLISLNEEEFEKYLNIKDPLHRKRLRLALKSIEAGRQEAAERMDCGQIARWLDDIGLPQYKQAFAMYRIDGAMLDELTVEDLLHLRITAGLHHAALRRGIQILRMVGFNVGRLHRKFDPLIISRGSCASAVQWWAQRCVIDWLKTSDLTEFTPNLLGSGIHGGLMILEPTFTAESLAAVLQIPAQKTLLRRHLSTQFSNLIGADLVAAKRQFLSQSDMPILTPKIKVKVSKKSGFSLAKKKGKNELVYDGGDLVCPVIKRTTVSAALQKMERAVKDKSPSQQNGDGKGNTLSEEVLRSMTTTNV